MLLKRVLGISSAKTQLNWLRKWVMRAVVCGKYQLFYYNLQVNLKIKKITCFNLIRLHL